MYFVLYTFADPNFSSESHRQHMSVGDDPLCGKSKHRHISTRHPLPWHNRFFRQYIGRNDRHLGLSGAPRSLIHLWTILRCMKRQIEVAEAQIRIDTIMRGRKYIPSGRGMYVISITGTKTAFYSQNT